MSILQYIYKPADLHLENWPPGELRLEGIPVTTNPQDADLFVCPGSLSLFPNPLDLYRLPYFRGNEAKHVFFDVSDVETQYHQPSIFIRCNLRPFNLAADPNSIQMAWPVEDFKECVDLPEGGFKYDVSFHGWLSSNTRKESVASVQRLSSSLRLDVAAYPNFYGYIEQTPEGKRRKKEYWRSLKESRIALCPQSIPGVFPYRYWEAMSAGRMPLLIGQNFVWPENVPDRFYIPNTSDVAAVVEQITRDYSDEQLIRIGQAQRLIWKEWLDGTYWPRLHAQQVLKKMAALHV